MARVHDLEVFLLGTKPKPDEFIVDFANSNVLLNNLDFRSWIRLDQFVMSWLLSSISEQMLGHVVHCQYAAEVWIVLEQLFSTKSKVRALQLRLSLQTLKKGNDSIEDYLLKMKSLATSLVIAGQQISNDELILYIRGGLGPEFESMIVNLTSRESVTLQEVQYMLQTHEMRLESLNTTTMVELSHSTVHFVHKQFSPTSHFRGSQRGRYNRGGGGRFTSNGRRSYNIKNTSNKQVSNLWKNRPYRSKMFLQI